MKIFIKPLNETASQFYNEHGHYHEGDAGLDLFVLEELTFREGETKPLHLGIGWARLPAHSPVVYIENAAADGQLHRIN
jgi:dUTP pyrophosphatase